MSSSTSLRTLDVYGCEGISSMPNLSSLVAQGLAIDCRGAGSFLQSWKRGGYLALNANANQAEGSEGAIRSSKVNAFVRDLEETSAEQVASLLAEELREASVEYKREVINRMSGILPAQLTACASALTTLLDDEQVEAETRVAVTKQLTSLRKSALVDVAPILMKLLAESTTSDDLKNAAAGALVELPLHALRKVMATLMEHLLSSLQTSAQVSNALAPRLCECEAGELKLCVDKMGAALGSSEEATQNLALGMLQRLPPSSWSGFVSQVASMAVDPDAKNRVKAASTLSCQGPEVLAQHPAAVQALVNGSQHTKATNAAILQLDENGKEQVGIELLKRLEALNRKKADSLTSFLNQSGVLLVSTGHSDKADELLDELLKLVDQDNVLGYYLRQLQNMPSTLFERITVQLVERWKAQLRDVDKDALSLVEFMSCVSPFHLCQIVPVAVEQLMASDPKQCAKALSCFTAIPRAAWPSELVDKLRASESEPSVRSWLARTFKRLAAADLATVDLGSFLLDAKAGTRNAAVAAIARLEPAHLQQYRTELLKLLADPREDRVGVIKALGKLTHDAEVVARLEALAAGLARDVSDPLTLDESCGAKFEQLGALPPQLLSANAAAMDSIEAALDSAYRQPVLQYSLAKLNGQQLTRFVSKLSLLLDDPVLDTRFEALLVSMRLPDEARKPLAEAASAVERQVLSDLTTRVFVPTVLSRLTRMPPVELAKHGAAVAALLGDYDGDAVVVPAARVLAKLQPNQLLPHVDALVATLAHPDWQAKRAALGALETLDAAGLTPEQKAAMKKALEVVVQGRHADGYEDE